MKVTTPNREKFGFRELPDGSGRVYCSHCYKVLATARTTDMRNHHASSYCSFRIATGVSAADKTRLGL
jgi:RNase P subunit RPR2